MEIIINGEKVKGDIREIMMTNASGDVTIIKSLGDNQCLRKEKGECFYFIDHIEHVIELKEEKDFICDELYNINNYYSTVEDAEKEVRRRRMRRIFEKYFNRHGNYKLTYTRGDENIKISKRNVIDIVGIGEFIFMEKHLDEVRALVKEYKEDILEMVR